MGEHELLGAIFWWWGMMRWLFALNSKALTFYFRFVFRIFGWNKNKMLWLVDIWDLWASMWVCHLFVYISTFYLLTVTDWRFWVIWRTTARSICTSLQKCGGRLIPRYLVVAFAFAMGDKGVAKSKQVMFGLPYLYGVCLIHMVQHPKLYSWADECDPADI